MKFHSSDAVFPVRLMAFAAALSFIALILFFAPTPVVRAAPKATTRHVNKLLDTDDGVCDTDCSLREALSVAVNGDTIDFPSLSGTIVLSPSLSNLVVNQAITITSPVGAIRISGGNAIRVMTIGANATLNGLTIRDGTGTSGYGGGILISSGDVNIINSVIVSNTATTFGGGGISNFGSLTVTNSTILNNVAANGGGIHNNFGLLSLSNVTVTNNIVTTNGGGIYGDGGTVSLTTTRIYSNAASSQGGGIHTLGNLNLAASNVYSNTSVSDGAGIRMSGASMSLDIDGSSIRTNSCASCSGGGIYSDGVVYLSNTSILSNTAGQGGGIYKIGNTALTLTGVTFSGNQAIGVGSGGGGIDVESFGGGTATLTNVTISGNSSDPDGTGWGGGMLVQNVTTTLSHITITKNKTGINGGGGIRTTGTLSFTIQNSIINGNTSVGGEDCVAGVTMTSLDYNLVNPATCNLNGTTTHNQSGDPKLTPLAGFGGPTFTHGLFSGSPAINAIPNGVNGCGTTYTTDQRGYPRPATGGTACDIGAFEGVLYELYLPLVLR